jgi:hypothetical protein
MNLQKFVTSVIKTSVMYFYRGCTTRLQQREKTKEWRTYFFLGKNLKHQMYIPHFYLQSHKRLQSLFAFHFTYSYSRSSCVLPFCIKIHQIFIKIFCFVVCSESRIIFYSKHLPGFQCLVVCV